jgi:hypothetical protein
MQQTINMVYSIRTQSFWNVKNGSVVCATSISLQKTIWINISSQNTWTKFQRLRIIIEISESHLGCKCMFGRLLWYSPMWRLWTSFSLWQRADGTEKIFLWGINLHPSYAFLNVSRDSCTDVFHLNRMTCLISSMVCLHQFDSIH